MDTEVVIAIIAACVSLVGTGFAYHQAQSAQTRSITTQLELHDKTTDAENELEILRARLNTQAAEHDARQDYEYEALKRLYKQCEPLLFLLNESAGAVISRVERIAEASREGHLTPGPGGWLSGNGYFRLSSMYRLVVPHVYVRLLQGTLTIVDLALDPDVRHQYKLAQLLSRSFTDDFDLSKREPRLLYKPNDPVAAEVARQEPAIYQLQGLYSGHRDIAVESLIKRDLAGPARCMSYGEFEVAYETKEGSVRDAFAPVRWLFHDFHPSTYPVLWRILIAQVLICHELRETQAARDDRARSHEGDVPRQRKEIDTSLFDWRAKSDPTTDESVVQIPFNVGQSYIDHQMSL